MTTDTITATSAAAVSRKLAALGFEKFDRWDEIGYSAHLDGKTIRVVHYSWQIGTAAAELHAAGFVIGNFQASKMPATGRQLEEFEVLGKVGR